MTFSVKNDYVWILLILYLCENSLLVNALLKKLLVLNKLYLIDFNFEEI